MEDVYFRGKVGDEGEPSKKGQARGLWAPEGSWGVVGDSHIRNRPSFALSSAPASLHKEPVLWEMRKQRLLAGKGPKEGSAL